LSNSTKEFIRMMKIFDKLHSEKGCLWDKKQTHQTLIKYLKEESAEFISAVRKKDFKGMQEELGDILLQVMFHSQMAKKKKKFTIHDVMKTLNDKLVRRHPHVFSGKKVKSVNDIIVNWGKIKKREKGK